MSLQSKVLIVKPTIHKIGQSRTDDEITSEIHREHQMADEAGRYTKALWPPGVMLPISSIEGAVRRYHKGRTILTGFGRLIPTVHFEDYETRIREFIGQFNDAADAFVDNFETTLAQCRRIQGETFNYEHYPMRHEVREQFSFTLFQAPVPRSSDLAVDYLCAERIAEMRSQIDRDVERAGRDAANQVMARVLARVDTIIQKLSDPEANFHDSLIQNLRHVLEIAPALNIGGDYEVTRLIEACQQGLLVAPEELRESALKRRLTNNAAKAIARTFGAMGARKLAA